MAISRKKFIKDGNLKKEVYQRWQSQERCLSNMAISRKKFIKDGNLKKEVYQIWQSQERSLSKINLRNFMFSMPTKAISCTPWVWSIFTSWYMSTIGMEIYRDSPPSPHKIVSACGHAVIGLITKSGNSTEIKRVRYHSQAGPIKYKYKLEALFVLFIIFRFGSQ